MSGRCVTGASTTLSGENMRIIDKLDAKIAKEYRIQAVRKSCNDSLHHFIQRFWHTVCHDPFRDNWHIQYLCNELQQVAERVAKREPNPYDLIINVPPGTSKTSICSIFFPVWCWTRWPELKFLTFSYNQQVANNAADNSQKIIESEAFQLVYPHIRLREGKEGVTDYEISERRPYGWRPTGGGRFSSSVRGTGTAFHGDILIGDDIINAEQAFSEADRMKANRWASQTLPSRKRIKEVAATIWIAQRLHEDDPPGHLLANKALKLKHICLPADISDPAYAELVSPSELKECYIDGLLDPARLSRNVIDVLTAQLGPYGAAAQLGQNPVPPTGGLFKVDKFVYSTALPPEVSIRRRVRYWDKAGSDPTKEKSREPAYTVGVLMWLLESGNWYVPDVVRGRWQANDREDIIRATAEADGQATEVWIEQEPGSGGKESAESTIRNLAGFTVRADRPVGNKVARAEPFAVQVERSHVILFRADWNHDFVEELRFFPNGRFKDQVDAASGAFSKLAAKREVWIGRR